MDRARILFIFFLCIVEVLGPSPFDCSMPPTVQNGYVSSSSSTSTTYSCNTGYQLSGSATAICEYDDYDGALWTSVPTCIAATNCNSPPPISDGSSGTPTRTTYGGTVIYSCNIGYVLSGSATVRCLASGSWSTRPTCTSVPCGDPPAIPNGSRTFTGTTFGDTATYSCNTGYQRLGPSTVTCQASGTWSDRPTCLAICGSPPSISNGSPGTPTGIIQGGTVMYSCNSGYQRLGSATVVCQDSGNWSPRPNCSAICGSPPSISNGSPGTPTSTVAGGSVIYTCNNGYQLSGSPLVTCQASGSWTARPSCSPICGSPPSISNGSPGTPTSIIQGGTVAYSCNTGYQLLGSATVVCQDSGNWSPRPNCLAICGSPPPISNGSPGMPTSTVAGGTVTYICNNGYQLSGSATVTCQASGSWTARPSCSPDQPGSCNDPPTIPNGSRIFTGTTFGDTAIYTCNIGYQLSGAATMICQASGSWSTAPTCTPVPCGSPPTIPNGSRTFTGTIFGDTATYTCNTGYQRSGAVTVTCQASGSWSTAPTCPPIPCGDPPTIPNGSRTFTDTTIGETATYICDDGYQRSGSAAVMCQASGSWSIIPSCNVAPQPGSCDNPPTIPNGFRTFVGTSFGESAFYTCNSGYQRSGSATVTCQASGSWSTRPTCKAICPPLTLVNGAVAYLPSSFIILEGTVAQHSCNTGYRLSGNGTRLCSNNNGTAGVWSLPNLSCRGIIIQLRFGDVRDCSQYTASEMVQKTDDITTTLVQGVIASCNCRLNSTFLFNAFLKCFADSPQHVTYRATLLSSSDLSTSKVLEYIENGFIPLQA
ncbi:sushi, von Willebrand factor type A, EGF and pentraxin domain-containing protein 1-like isoform X3 [Halichondria panicea]|uniref:sushi, von Willebrand factor type A, EGF and pentraxin domain-containing protein 1-like isoform X3 n=1 Tax=Halichondria panicea TaxID=6063 RepID=UPI00312BBB95